MPLTRIDSAFLDLDAIGGIDFDVNSSVPTLKVEATNHRVGIGHNSPAYKLDVVGDVNISSGSNYLVAGSQISTANVAEDSSYLYYTDARAIAAVTGSALDMGSNTITTTGAGSFASLSTGASGVGVNISTSTISGPATLTIDPAAVGDNTGTVVIAGDLQVDGTTTTINSTTLTVDDKNLVLASGAANNAAADGAGITIDTADATLLYKATPDAWVFNKSVGIGTDNPQDLLSVGSGTLADQRISLFSNAAAGGDVYGSILFRYNSANGNKNAKISALRTGGSSGSDLVFYTRTQADAVNNDGGEERLRINSSGNVGIGTDSPDFKLHSNETGGSSIAGLFETNQTDAYISFQASGTTTNSTVRIGAVGDNFQAFVNGAERLRIESDGDVSIGSASNYGGIRGWNSSTGDMIIDADKSASGTSGSNLIFKSRGSEKLRITSAQKIYLGPYKAATEYGTVADNVPYKIGVSPYGWQNGGDIAEISMGSHGGTGQDDGQIIFKTASNVHSDSTGLVERLRINADGKVGIGIAQPQKNLDVLSASDDFVSVGSRTLGAGQWTGIHFGYREDNTAYRKSAIVFERVDNAARGKIHILNNGANSNASATLSDARLTIDSAGNVGINTTTPAAKLHINGGAANYTPNSSGTTLFKLSGGSSSIYSMFIGIDNDGGYIGHNGNGRKLFLQTNETTRMTIDTSGNVGVGTDNPVRPLHVFSGGNTTARIHATGSAGYAQLEFLHDSDSSTWIWKNGSTQGGYAGTHSWNFYNPHNSAIAFYTNTTEKVRISGNGYLGVGVDPTDSLHVQTSNTTGSFRLGGNNTGHRVYINSSPTTSYLDCYGSNAHQPFRINASPLYLNHSGGGDVAINNSGTVRAKLDLRQSSGHPAFNIGFPDSSFYRNLGTVGPYDTAGNNASGAQYLHIRLRTIWNDASMTMFRLTGYYSYSAYTESYVGMYRYANNSYRSTPYGQIISNQGNRTTVHSMYNTTADPGYLVIVCDWGTNYMGLMIEHIGAGSSYGSGMQQDLEIIDTKRSSSTSAQW